jgi:hypothetical protein
MWTLASIDRDWLNTEIIVNATSHRLEFTNPAGVLYAQSRGLSYPGGVIKAAMNNTLGDKYVALKYFPRDDRSEPWDPSIGVLDPRDIAARLRVHPQRDPQG